MRCKHYWCIHSYVVGFVEWSTDKIHLPIEYWSNDWGNIPSKDHCFQQVLTTTIIYIVPINRGGILIRWDIIIMIFIRFFLSITGLQPSVMIDNGFLQCITILLKHKVPKDFSIRAQFVFSESVQGHTDADYGKHKLK